MMHEPAPATLAIGTQVSAKYKGAFCEAKVRSVVKQVKCRVTFSLGLGSTTLSDEYVQVNPPGSNLVVGATVKAKHPDKQEYIEAVINKIQDQSQYTVVFDDGDITTLRRNALCMKSGKHYNASESLDNLPLTHPEHFSTPVSGSRRKKGWARGGAGPESDDEGSSSGSEDTVIPSSYLANIGRVVWAENTDKKSKARESWFPALIVAPSASGQGKIDTKEEFLIRSFKDGRYYTVSKKDTQKFHRDSPRKSDVASLKEAIEKAVTYINKEELPPLWDREVLFNMGEESTTESSETESLADDEENETQEDKDKLVAELYKHMEDRGSPINRTPTIGSKELDLFMLFKVVYKLGGHTRVTNNNLWRQVASKLGFETTWCTNQVRVHYKRYLLSFEELNKTLGCTMIQTSSKQTSSRVQIRGKHRSGGSKSESNAENESDKSSIGSQDETAGGLMTALKRDITPSRESKSEEDKKEPTAKKSKADKTSNNKEPPTSKADKLKKEEESSVSVTKKVEETKMATRPRRDSTSSLAAAMQVKAQKDNIGDDSRRPIVRMDRDKDTENEVRKLQTKPSGSGKAKDKEIIKEEEKPSEEKEIDDDEGEDDDEEDPEEDGRPPPPTTPNVNEPPKKGEKKNPRDSPVYGQDPEDSKSSTDMNMAPTSGSSKSKGGRKKLVKKKNPRDKPPPLDDEDDTPVANEKQDLPDHVNVEVGDKIKVYYRHNQVYEAKVIKIREPKTGERWPKYLVHYQGWNARYDEWVKRSKIAENLSWSKERLKSSWTSRVQPTEGASSSSASSGGGSIAKLNDSSNDSTSAKKEPRTSRKDDKASKEKEPTGGSNNKDKASGRGSRKLSTPTTPSSTKNTANDSRASTPSQSRGGSRTGSPALKRQSSRSSIKKESEESDEDADGESGANARKSRRLNSSQTGSEGRRSGRKRPAHLTGGPNKDESENDEIDVEKDVTDTTKPDLPATPSKTKRTRKSGPSTPKQQSQPANLQAQDESDEKSSDSGSVVGNRPSRSRDRATTRQLTSSGKKERGKSNSKASKGRSEEDEEEDPYAFKEPVPLDESRNTSTPGKAPGPPAASTISSNAVPSTTTAESAPSLASLAKKAGLKEPSTDVKNESKKKGPVNSSVSTRSKRESDSAESSSDEGGKKNLRTSRTGSNKTGNKSGLSDATKLATSSDETEKEEKKPDLISTPVQSPTEETEKASGTTPNNPVAKVAIEPNSEIETCNPNSQPDETPDVKDEPKEEEEEAFDMDTVVSEDLQGGKPVLNLTKKQQELFPFLSAMRTTPMSGVQISGVQLSGAPLDIGARSPSKSPSKECKTDSTASDYSDSREDSKSSTTQASGAESSPRSASSSSKPLASGASTPGPHRKFSTKKRKTPRKPNSSELVASESESDLNSEDEKSNLANSLNLSSTVSGRSRGPSPGVEPAGTALGNNSSKGPNVKGLFGGGAMPSTSSVGIKRGSEGDVSPGELLIDEKPSKKKVKKEELQEDLDLACGETIPGSPVHPSSISTEPLVKVTKASSSRLEMPFASVPESIPGPSEPKKEIDKKEPIKQAHKPPTEPVGNSINNSKPVPKVTSKYEETREDPLESSSASQSPSDSRIPADTPKSPAESSEVDMDSLSGRKEPESEDSRLDMDGGSVTSETRRPKRKAPNSPAHSAKRKQRKTREAALRGSRGRGRYSSSRVMSSTRGSTVLDDETDDCEEPKDPALASLGNLDNDALTALTQRPPKASKYNFFVDLNDTMTSKERVSKLQESIDRLRKTYLNVKSDLAQVERRRKKMKRKEREKSEKASAANNANSSAGAAVVEAVA